MTKSNSIRMIARTDSNGREAIERQHVRNLRQCIFPTFVFQIRLIDKKLADRNALPLSCEGFPELSC